MAVMTSAKPLAVVTGASSGIGLELARQFARNGFALIVAAEDEAIASIPALLEPDSSVGATITPVRVDLATREGVEALWEEIRSSTAPVEAIALNAGVGVGGDFTTETSLEDELRLIALNVTSVVHLAKLVVPGMVERQRGRILITASIAGIMPTPLEAVYGASKAFDLEFAASLRHELRDTGVTVTALMPGPTDTNFFRRAGLADTKVAEKALENDPADVARMGFEALMTGKDRVVAGNLEVKAQGAVARFVPEGVKAAMHEKLAQPKGK